MKVRILNRLCFIIKSDINLYIEEIHSKFTYRIRQGLIQLKTLLIIKLEIIIIIYNCFFVSVKKYIFLIITKLLTGYFH